MTRIPSVLWTAALAVPLVAPLCLTLGGTRGLRAAEEPPSWSPANAADYLDSPATWWSTWNGAARCCGWRHERGGTDGIVHHVGVADDSGTQRGGVDLAELQLRTVAVAEKIISDAATAYAVLALTYADSLAGVHRAE